MRSFKLRRWVAVLGVTGALSVPAPLLASGFQLWEQDAASIGNYHAGYAAIAEDASTAFYNPAGMTRFKEQQMVLSTVGVMTDFKYTGTVAVNTILGGAPRGAVAQGGNFGFVPALHYVAPISDRVGFGFSVDVPFGLKTTYGRKTFVRYAATTTSATVIDISPSLAFQLTDKASIGAGFDIQRMYAEFDQVGGIGFPTLDAEGIFDKGSDTGYGGHFGALYQFNDKHRVGLSYHTQVVHHLNGPSSFVGPLADAYAGGPFSSQAFASLTLPAYTALSAYSQPLDKFAFMGSVIYTQWNIQRTISIHDVSGIVGLAESKQIQVTVPQYLRNTWNIALGANYLASEKIKIRTGLGFDQTPTNDTYRNVTLPDNNRYVVALGGHYQATNTLGMDLSWMHIFMNRSHINPPALVSGDQQTTTSGYVTGGADVIGAQLTWDMV